MSATGEKTERPGAVGRFVLLLWAGNSEPVPEYVHLQKEAYLLQKAFHELASDADYEPGLLGPHSGAVSDEIERLAFAGIISASRDRIGLTADGRRAAAAIREKTGGKTVQRIEEFKDLLNDLTRDELLAFVHFAYPSQDGLEKESVEYRYLLPRRVGLATSMYEKGKLSAQRAAQISGIYLEDFLEELKRRAGKI